ncbi:MAG: hypothetical protein KDB04_09735 [Acidimicrobiales bacterium]|nr:hypothetical protein [Acidimicrobiales bacterium]HRW39545.1 hypothetical protein [Aquihabitans sp.]
MSSPAVVACRTRRDVVVVRGDDAATYLQGQLSQDVVGLPTGESAWSFVLGPQGKVDGWGRVHRLADDAFEIDVDPGAGLEWEARLRRFLLRTRADIVVEPDVAALAVRGTTVPGGLPTAGPSLVGSDLLRVAPDAWPASMPPDAVEVGAAALEARRIRAGVPAWGREIDHDTIPATLGAWVVETSVSFTKGCYTGQELVARIDSRGGHVPRRLVGIECTGPAPAAGAPVHVDDAMVGTVTSSVDEPGRGAVALAFAPRAVDIGADGIACEVAGSPGRLRPLPLPT